MELEPELFRAYADTFIPRWDVYPRQLPNGRYTQIKEPLTIDMVASHLTNHHRGLHPLTLGAYALDKENNANWICLDADVNEQWEAIWRIAHNLKREGVASYPEASRRGGHLWMFMPTMTGSDARRFGKWLLHEHQCADMDIELYPKQDRLLSGAGSFVRLPLGVHRKTGKVYYFLDLSGEPLLSTITGQIEILANPERVPIDFINYGLTQVHDTQPATPTPYFDVSKSGVGETLSERLKNTISVYQFVSQYVELDVQGRGHCPFHDDHHKSFQVNDQRNYWNCYANCGGGSIIDFYSKWREKSGEDPSFTATIKSLAEMLL